MNEYVVIYDEKEGVKFQRDVEMISNHIAIIERLKNDMIEWGYTPSKVEWHTLTGKIIVWKI